MKAFNTALLASTNSDRVQVASSLALKSPHASVEEPTSKLQHQRQVLPEADHNTVQKVVCWAVLVSGEEQEQAEEATELRTRRLSAREAAQRDQLLKALCTPGGISSFIPEFASHTPPQHPKAVL